MPKINKPKGGASWMKRGKAAQDAITRDEQAAEERKAQRDKPFRFYLPEGAETSITFLDGELDDDGILDCPMFYEHQVKRNGDWKNWYVCTQDDDSEPCPVCESGSTPALVSVFTIIDHSVYTAKNKKVYRDNKKLFVCKRATYKILQKLASKRGGLKGCTFDVSRSSDDSANVGDIFDFTEKNTLEAIYETYNIAEEDQGVFDYEEVFPYLNQTQLRELGFGNSENVPGSADSGSTKSGKSYEDEL